MRSVCFVKRHEFDFSGKVLEDSIHLGDIDNDGESELIVGNTQGVLSIFKGDKLWQTISGLGMSASVSVGDVMNCGSNAVVTVSGEGWCHIYLCLNNAGEKLQLVHKQRIPANTKVMILGDVLGDGQTDMILGLSDRVVRVYKWLQTPTEASLVCLNKCECANQIGSLCITKDDAGKQVLLVSQPGASYMSINFRDGGANVEYHVVSPAKQGPSHVTSKVIGGVGEGEALALSLLDGTIVLVRNKNQLLWTINVEQQIFTIGKVSVCKDKTEQLVTSSWSGHTFIVDQEGNSVCFELGQAIQAFTAGVYSSRATTVFIYVTFNNKIFVYYDIAVESLKLFSLYALQSKDPELAELSRRDLKELTEFSLYH